MTVGESVFVDTGDSVAGAGGVGVDTGDSAAGAGGVSVDAGCGAVSDAAELGEAVAAPVVTSVTCVGVPGVTSRMGGLMHAPSRIATIPVMPRSARIDIGKVRLRRVIM
jgi:hypothetical protein